jgi:hypothetical protein
LPNTLTSLSTDPNHQGGASHADGRLSIRPSRRTKPTVAPLRRGLRDSKQASTSDQTSEFGDQELKVADNFTVTGTTSICQPGRQPAGS